MTNVSLNKKTTLMKKSTKTIKQTKLAIQLTSMRTKMIKKNLTFTQQKTPKQKTLNLNLRQVSMSKFAKGLIGKNPLITQKSLKGANVRVGIRHLSSKVKTPKNNNKPEKEIIKTQKRRIETNLYVDAASLSYDKIKEIIHLEIDELEKKKFDNRKNYLKIKVSYLCFYKIILILLRKMI